MRRRYWPIVGVVLAALAAALPITGVTHTRLGTAQIIYAAALLALLVRLVADARVSRAARVLRPADRDAAGAVANRP